MSWFDKFVKNDIPQNSFILDVGCGPLARFAKEFAKEILMLMH